MVLRAAGSAGMRRLSGAPSHEVVSLHWLPLERLLAEETRSTLQYQVEETVLDLPCLRIDGLVIWSSALDWQVTEGTMEAFCRRFTSLPVVSVGRAFAGIPSVLVDNYQGMRDAVCHLIEHHGHRRIAFLRGPEGAQEEELRFRAYRDALTDHGLPLAAELISGHTNWDRSDGPVAIADFLDARGLRPKLDFDAIISVGDDLTREMAYAFAVKEDACGFLGDGTSTYGHMTGVKNAIAASGIKPVTGHPYFDQTGKANWTASQNNAIYNYLFVRGHDGLYCYDLREPAR